MEERKKCFGTNGKMIKITVIIPTFNMEPFIGKCLDSVLEQSLKEIEIICIDDGSTDHTEQLIYQFQKEHANIIYKKQMNLGAGPARNLGIACASGKYITFMDADDFYPDTCALEYLYEAAERLQIEICGGSRCVCHEDVIALHGAKKELIFSEDQILAAGQFSAWNGYQQFIYNKDFITKNQLKFPNYRRCQDPPFFAKALSLVKEIFVCGIFSYCYRKEHKEVILDQIKALDYLKGIRDTLEITAQSGMWKMYTNVLNHFFGEASAIMYKYIAEGNQEMLLLSREIRKLILPGKILKEEYVHEKKSLLEEDQIAAYVMRVREKWDQFLEQLRAEKVLIFGAGTMARKLYEVFKEKNVYVEAFIVSDTEQNVQQIEGIKVRQINDYCQISDQYFVIFAAFGFWINEMNMILKEKGFSKYKQVNLEELYLYADRIVHKG